MISVIIPTYNRASVISKSIDSVLAQTYEDFELIIVDDGSTDNTKEVIDSYTDDRIRYIYNDSDNHGPSTARNIGIDAAKGEYIAFNDSDDEWNSDKLRLQLLFLKDTNADVSFCTMHKKKGKRDIYIPPKTFRESDCTLENELISSFTGTPAFFGKVECFQKVKFDEKMRCNEDWEIMIRLLVNYMVLFQRESLVEISVSENSVGSDVDRAIEAMEYIYCKHESLYQRHPRSQKRFLMGRKYNIALAKEQRTLECGTERGTNKLGRIINSIYRKVVRYGYAVRILIADKVRVF